jgi:hypothetical protein
MILINGARRCNVLDWRSRVPTGAISIGAGATLKRPFFLMVELVAQELMCFSLADNFLQADS